MKMKKLLACVLSAAMCLSMYTAPTAVYAEETEEEELAYEVYTPDTLMMVTGAEDCYIWDGWYSDSTDSETMDITGCEVLQGDKVLSAYVNEDGEIVLDAADSGAATLRIYYNVKDGYTDANNGSVDVIVHVAPYIADFSICMDPDAGYITRNQEVSLWTDDFLYTDGSEEHDLTFEWSMTSDVADDAAVLEMTGPDSSSCTVRGADAAENGHWPIYDITCEAYDGDILVGTTLICLVYNESYYALDVSGFDDTMLTGDSCVIEPLLYHYTPDSPEGELVDASAYELSWGCENCTVENNDDGTYTVTAEDNYCSIGLDAEGSNGEDEIHASWSGWTDLTDEEDQNRIHTSADCGDEITMMPDESYVVHISGTLGDYLEDVPLTITAASVTEGEDIASVYDIDGQDIYITAASCGTAVVDVSYEIPDDYANYVDVNNGHVTLVVSVVPVHAYYYIERDTDSNYISEGKTIHFWMEDLDIQGEYDPSDIDYVWVLDSDDPEEALDAVSMTQDPEDPTKCSVTCTSAAPENNTWYYLSCTVYYQGIEVGMDMTDLIYVSEYYDLTVTGFREDMDGGDSCTVKPVITHYNEEAPDGETVPAASYTMEYDHYGCTVLDNGNGTYTITCQSPAYCWVRFYTELDGVDISCYLESMYEDERDTCYFRISGDDRYKTAAATAEQLYYNWNDGEPFDTFVIASADNFPDALAGCPLAYQQNAPILLAGKNEKKNQTTYDAINQFGTGDAMIYILGGTSAVPKIVEDNLKDQGYSVIRLAGDNRYETNVKIMEAMDCGSAIAVVSGTNYADALSISGIAGVDRMPIVLANPKTGLTQTQIDTVKINEVKTIYVIGGTAAVTEATEAQLAEEFPDAGIVRIAGDNRYETSVKIAEQFNLNDMDDAVIAYGKNFPDGLTGGVLAASLNAPLLLTDGGKTSVAVDTEYLEGSSHLFLYVMGGESVVSTTTARTFSEIILEKMGEIGE